MSSETHPISFREQNLEPGYSSDIKPFDPFPEPTAEQGRTLVVHVQQEAAGVQAQERLDQERAEAGRPFQEQPELESSRLDGCARRHPAVLVAPGARAGVQLAAREDEVREKTPPVVAEESEFARQNRHSQELAMLHRHRRDLHNGGRGLNTGRVGERLRGQQAPTTQANNPGLSYMIKVLVLYLYMFCIVCILIFYSY